MVFGWDPLWPSCFWAPFIEAFHMSNLANVYFFWFSFPASIIYFNHKHCLAHQWPDVPSAHDPFYHANLKFFFQLNSRKKIDIFASKNKKNKKKSSWWASGVTRVINTCGVENGSRFPTRPETVFLSHYLSLSLYNFTPTFPKYNALLYEPNCHDHFPHSHFIIFFFPNFHLITWYSHQLQL